MSGKAIVGAGVSSSPTMVDLMFDYSLVLAALSDEYPLMALVITWA